MSLSMLALCPGLGPLRLPLWVLTFGEDVSGIAPYSVLNVTKIIFEISDFNEVSKDL